MPVLLHMNTYSLMRQGFNLTRAGRRGRTIIGNLCHGPCPWTAWRGGGGDVTMCYWSLWGHPSPCLTWSLQHCPSANLPGCTQQHPHSPPPSHRKRDQSGPLPFGIMHPPGCAGPQQLVSRTTLIIFKFSTSHHIPCF